MPIERGLGSYPKLIEVIEVGELRGKGIEGDPIRSVLVYCTKEGEKIAEGPDPCTDGLASIIEYQALLNAIRWALGEEGEFPEHDPKKPYGWRTELRRRAGLK